jgi:hypothetical protein
MVGLNVRKWGFYDKTVKNFKPFCWWDAFRSVWMTQQNAPINSDFYRFSWSGAHSYQYSTRYSAESKQGGTNSWPTWTTNIYNNPVPTSRQTSTTRFQILRKHNDKLKFDLIIKNFARVSNIRLRRDELSSRRYSCLIGIFTSN